MRYFYAVFGFVLVVLSGVVLQPAFDSGVALVASVPVLGLIVGFWFWFLALQEDNA